MTLVIRHLDTPADAGRAVELQRAVWGHEEAPAHVLLTAAHNGGLLAGAFVDGVLAGFVWGFLGLDGRAEPPRLKHCSHQLGVHPDFRNHGLGFALKRFQWEFVRRQGVDLVTWTYDPLLATNAHLNIARLGAVCNTYHRDLYGHLDDDLNAGLPTDRFQVDLWVNSRRVAEAMSGEAARRVDLDAAYWINRCDGGQPALPVVPRTLVGAAAVAIPADFGSLKAADPALAAQWRLALRAAFEALFAAGYSVVDFARRPDCGVYLLQPTG